MSAVEAIMTAVKAKDVAAVQALLDRDPSLVNAANDRGERPILLATYHGAGAVVALLRERGAEINLFEAAALGDTDRIRHLLDTEPAHIATHSSDGWTALHLAAHFGHMEALTLLRERGANVHARSTNQLDNTALHAAVAGGHPAVVAYLLAHGADVNAKQHGGYTALHQAAHAGRPDLIDLLLGHGAATNLLTDAGQTPLDLALAQGHAAAAERLRAAATA